MSEQRAYCKSCGAPVLWVATEGGKRMPLDYEPERRFILDGHTEPMTARMRKTYLSHFSSCPSANEHRKERADG